MGNGTSIGRVRGLGAAHTGPHHWLVQRLTAIGNLLLVLWLVVSLLMLPDLGFATVSEWLARPVPATAMALLIISTFWHARLGMQVAIEDYVHGANRVAALVAINLLAFGGAAFGLFCVIRLALGGA
ncbi:MAG: succinate dehydrogenase, hydrophobic membrane anchor protein [Sphingomonadaceae bacterium]